MGACLHQLLKPEEREFVVDSGASMRMISRKDLSNAEMDILKKSCSPTTVITANGEVQTHEEAIVHVKELGIFLTMKVLGKFCYENGYSYKWINGQKPHLIEEWDSDTVQYGELRSSRGSWLVKFFLCIFIDFKDTFETGESFFVIFFILIFFSNNHLSSASVQLG